MTPQELKNSILQLAIQGKLVEQRPEEGTGAELLREISTQRRRDAEAAKKESRAKSAKSAKESRLASNVSRPVEDAPFEIPESWVWVHWGDVVNIVSARRVHQSDWKKEGVPFYRAREIAKLSADGYVDNDLFISQELYDAFSKSGVPKEGDLMVTAVGTLGKTYIVKDTDHFYYKDASVICLENYARLSPQYLKYLMETELMKNQIKGNSSGTTVATLTMVRMEKYLLPLPPLAEQKRIVAKIEELLPLIDRYEKAWSRLEEFTRRFPEDMRKSVLQMAIQGKLVEQRPEEGTGAELLREISTQRRRGAEDAKRKSRAKSAKSAKESRLASNVSRPVEDAPFEIPASWAWVRLGELLLSQPSNGVSPHGVDYPTPYKNLTLTATTSGYFRPEAFKYVEVSSELAEKYYLHDDDILIQRSNSRELVGTSCIYRHGDNKFIYPDLMMRLHLLDGVSVDFVDFVLKSPPCRAYFQATASGTSESMPKINQFIVRNTLIPLPPLAEQKRIVAKLEEILPLCEQLKKSLEDTP